MGLKRFRVCCRRLKSAPDGGRQYAVGLRVGYWPCVRGPYAQLALGPWSVSAWFGLPGETP